MVLSNEIIEGFMEIYRDEFGEEITRDEAREAAARMVALYELLLLPLPHEIEAMERSGDPHPPTSSEGV